MGILFTTWVVAVLAIWVYMSIWFLLAVALKRNDLADIAWGLGFIFIALISIWYQGDINLMFAVVLVLVAIWGLRLAGHIYLRNRHKKEDFRYLKWRQEWGKWFYIRSYLQVFMLQGAFLLIIALNIIIAATHGRDSLNFINVIGLAVWLVGFIFEAVSDWQLARFIKDPINKDIVMTSGLWRYSRHPNYFGEVAQWWGIWLIVVGANWWWLGIVSPLLITFLILKVSGVPMLEKKYFGRLDFENYKKTTNKFFPWLPKQID